MVRRFLYCVVIAACTGVAALVAAERATFILSNGERLSGTVVSQRGNSYRDNLGRGDLALQTDDGRVIQIRLDQVAVIEFGGGRPTPAELDALPYDDTQMIVRRNGSLESGQFLNIIAGNDAVRWQGRNGRQQTIPFRNLTRIYLNTDRARSAFNDTNRSNPSFRGRGRDDSRFGNQNDPGVGGNNRAGNNRVAGTSGTGQNLGEVRVNANQPWTDTGLNVRAGDLVMFRASGQISWGHGAEQTAGPGGNPTLKRADYPVSSTPVGGLIGQVGNSAPFAIGSNAQAIRMPANGMLMLGVNDNELSDNSGSFTVTITRQ